MFFELVLWERLLSEGLSDGNVLTNGIAGPVSVTTFDGPILVFSWLLTHLLQL